MWSRLLEDASLVAVDGERLMGAVLTVHRPPWEGLPDCPLIIDLFVDRDHRRQGIGRHLLMRAMSALAEVGESQVALRVDENNRPAKGCIGRSGSPKHRHLLGDFRVIDLLKISQ